jgi:hypothetical protein
LKGVEFSFFQPFSTFFNSLQLLSGVEVERRALSDNLQAPFVSAEVDFLLTFALTLVLVSG